MYDIELNLKFHDGVAEWYFFKMFIFSIGRFEAFPDNLTADEILAQARAAANEAADMLTFRAPQAKVISYNT